MRAWGYLLWMGTVMLLAVKTMAAISAALEKDQGAKFRGLLKGLMPTAADAYSTKEQKFRAHLGSSLIGRECSRELWYSFRWSTAKDFDGRMLRLFNRGHLEEPRMVALLQMIGCTVWQVDENGKQFRVSGYKGHSGGSLDGVAIGIPDLPEGTACLTEFKTHGEKSFFKLLEKGVISAKWEHYIQMTDYMGKNGLGYALYMAVNKNTDELYAEIVTFDPMVYQRYLDRAKMIIDSTSVPPKLNNASLGWYGCKFCDHSNLCHNPNSRPVKTCRSCEHSSVETGGRWICLLTKEGETLSEEKQLVGCPNYSFDARAYQK